MNTSTCLILSAGFGTRMGKIGEHYPKGLWPLFHHSILYYQLCYVTDLGIKTVFINVHHLADQFIDYIQTIEKKFSQLDIHILLEQDILDSGGGIHNCLPYVNEEYLLVINGDAFYFSNQVNQLQVREQSVLFAVEVASESHYNRLQVEKGLLKSIVTPSKSAPTITFSGVSLLYIPNIKLQKGPSRFFESVANYINQDIQVVSDNEYEYLDLGTKQLYVDFYSTYVDENTGLKIKSFFSKHGVAVERKPPNYIWKNEYLAYQLCMNGRCFVSISCTEQCLDNNYLQIGTVRDLL